MAKKLISSSIFKKNCEHLNLNQGPVEQVNPSVTHQSGITGT